jgi:pectate lyase
MNKQAVKIINLFLLILFKTSFGFCQHENTIAFPGALGFGKYASGGRGGEVILVTNLNADGPGSFKEAAEKNIPRIIVFKVAGTIRLKKKLSIAANATIAGQTAPGDGICIADHSVVLGGDNIIIQYMRFRMGDRYQNQGMVNGSGSDDAFGGTKRKNILIDHCSMSWSTDEVFSLYGGDSTTIQWCMISEPLNYSYHFETDDKDFEKHGYGGIWGGQHLTAHHNLFAHCVSRNPRFNGARLGSSEEFVDFRNNVIYNWGNNSVYGGEGGKYNILGNYYKPGPSTNKKVNARIVNPSSTGDGKGFGQFFVANNQVVGNDQVTANNILGVEFSISLSNSAIANVIMEKPFSTSTMPEQNAYDAYLAVIAGVGASYKRDTLDLRIIKNVLETTGKIIDVQGGYAHGTSFDQTILAWPYLKWEKAPLDTDEDGIPDDWEIKQGLNPNNHSDAKLCSIQLMYTNIEVYIHSITK